MSTYAIGDVQGCFDGLQHLLKIINFKIDKDELIFLGDVVNRGKQSLKTLRFIKDLNANAQMVIGNHDFHLLACGFGVKKTNPKDTFIDILTATDKNNLLDFLLQQDIVIKQNNAFFVHAGIPPIWDEPTTLQYATEISKNIIKNPTHFVQQMYLETTTYNKNLPNTKKLCYGVNAFMRIRFCDEFGKLDFTTKGNFTHPPKNHKAWFLHPRLVKNKIYFGHWSTLKGVNTHNIYPLDFGYVWGGKLACIRLEDDRIFSI